MVIFPNAKINLGLQVRAKRQDGYHDLHTLFLPINLKDALEIVPAANNDKAPVSFTQSGLNILGAPTDNLCIKAYHLLKKDFPQLPSIQLHLHKCIPMGAGMGGGSSDAAFTLILLNNLFDLHISTEKLSHYALQLGSDCPFFIYNKPSIGEGRGEVLQPIPLDLSSYKFLIVYPGIHVPTKEAFEGIVPSPSSTNLQESILQPIEEWRNNLVNDFEKTVFLKHPLLKEIKETLYTKGASYASMSGSGSVLFGIFKKEATPSLNFPDTYFCKWV